MITNLFDTVLDALKQRWKVKHAPRTKRAFRCQCGSPVFFRNSHCLSCQAPLGYAPMRGDLKALEPGDAPGTWRIAGDDNDQVYRRCTNFHSAAGCNWLVPVEDPEERCLSCRLSRNVADLTDADNQRYWRAIEAGKRRLISQLLALGLPVVSKESDPERGLAFDLLRSPAGGPRVLTGHGNGLITLNVEEADDAIRERIRTELHEPYRTLLGHLRHEIGHYYWDRLVRDSSWLEPFRALFGDERADYGEALKANYEQGPPADWSERFISSYASAHPWEDWAETWAHFLHVVDSLDTAVAHGLDADDLELEIDPFTRDDLYAPDDPQAERFLFLLNAWIEMVTVLNDLARSLGHRDFYPFAMPRAVVKKLHFIALVIRDAQESAAAT
ncbi:MAG: putative zinc-binding metallopeptidase [Chromatiaceae bacterium]|jgi:hypothetical protein